MLKELTINLNTIDNVKTFVEYVAKYPEIQVDVSSGTYSVDGKSILGLFSLNLTKKLHLSIYYHDERILNNILQDLSSYIVA